VKADDIDVVSVVVANHLHREIVEALAAAGKHVLCEKPLGMNARAAEDMAAAADAAKRRLMEAFMYRFHPAMRLFVDGLRDPMHVQASFGFKLDGAANYRFRAALGGGALLDVGCYTVSVARWILGEPVDVLARSRMRSGVDMTVAALLTFARGETAAVWASFESPEEQELTVITPERAHRRELPFTAGHDPQDPYQLMVESFAESVLHGRPVAIPPSESIANMRVLDRIKEAAAT